jgi:hypothetical protein
MNTSKYRIIITLNLIKYVYKLYMRRGAIRSRVLGADNERGPRSWLPLCALLVEVTIMGRTVGAEMVRRSAEFIESSASVV